MKGTVTPISWWEAEPGRLTREIEAMARAAPELEWNAEKGAWVGLAPLWPFDRPKPASLDAFVGTRRFRLAVWPFEAHPAVAPRFVPLDPEPELLERTLHRWHVNGDGTLCFFQRAFDWIGQELSASLVPKAAGWFLEYLLMKAERIDSMTVNGIVADNSQDYLFSGELGDSA